MTTRTFKQMGQGYGSSNCTVTAKIDGATVFSGIVPSANQRLPVGPTDTEDAYPTLFTWTNDVDFEGTQTMEITVTGATVLLAATNANYMRSAVQTEGIIENPDPNYVPTNYESTGPDTYGVIFKEEVDGFVYTDPTTNVTIDGVPKSVARDSSLLGQRHWTISPGSTFTCQLNVQAGLA
jgi:hypothetical protein